MTANRGYIGFYAIFMKEVITYKGSEGVALAAHRPAAKVVHDTDMLNSNNKTYNIHQTVTFTTERALVVAHSRQAKDAVQRSNA